MVPLNHTHVIYLTLRREHKPEVARGPGEKTTNDKCGQHNKALLPSGDDDTSDLAMTQEQLLQDDSGLPETPVPC